MLTIDFYSDPLTVEQISKTKDDAEKAVIIGAAAARRFSIKVVFMVAALELIATVILCKVVNLPLLDTLMTALTITTVVQIATAPDWWKELNVWGRRRKSEGDRVAESFGALHPSEATYLFELCQSHRELDEYRLKVLALGRTITPAELRKMGRWARATPYQRASERVGQPRSIY